MTFLSADFASPETGLARTQPLNQSGLMARPWLIWFLNIWTNIRNLNSAITNLPVYANNAAALAGGLKVGDFYRTGADPDPVCVVH